MYVNGACKKLLLRRATAITEPLAGESKPEVWINWLSPCKEPGSGTLNSLHFSNALSIEESTGQSLFC